MRHRAAGLVAISADGEFHGSRLGLEVNGSLSRSDGSVAGHDFSKDGVSACLVRIESSREVESLAGSPSRGVGGSYFLAVVVNLDGVSAFGLVSGAEVSGVEADGKSLVDS